MLEFRRKPSVLRYMARALLPSAAKRAPLRFPDLVARWHGLRPHPAEVDDVGRLVEEPPSARLPFLFFQVVGFRLQMALLTHPAFPVPIWKVLQVRNRILQHVPVARGATVELQVRLAAHRILERGVEIDLHATATQAGVVAWEAVNTFYVRGSFGTPTHSGVAQIDEPEGAPLAAWKMPSSGAWRCASLTGDFNGIHLSDAYARRFGFRSAFFHPQRVLGACLARLPALAPDAPRSLEASIRGPVPYGAGVELRAVAQSAPPWTFGLWTESDARPAILARYGPGGAQPGGVQRGSVQGRP